MSYYDDYDANASDDEAPSPLPPYRCIFAEPGEKDETHIHVLIFLSPLLE